MKNIFKQTGILLIGVLFIASCKKEDLSALNIDPNGVNDLDMAYLVSTATLRIGGEYENTRANMLYAATMIQHTASTAGYFSGDKYLYNAQYSGAYMETHFTNIARLYSHVITKTEGDAAQVNINASAMILRAFDLHRMTDLYGDIPYEQAGKGLEGAENWFPKYDNQKDVYAALVRDIKTARDKLNASARSLGAQDFIYAGDIAKWKKFANAMLMRIGLRMSKKDAATGKTVFAEAFASGAFTSNADNALIKYGGPQGHNRNGLNDGYWNTYKYSKDCKISKTFLDWMRVNKDPRMMIVSGGTGDPEVPASWKTDTSEQKGMPNGYRSSNITSVLSPADAAAYNTSGIGNKIFSMLNLKYLDLEDPYPLITYAEVELMAAEAVLLGWITTGTAEEHFNAGVTAAINSWTAFDPSFARSGSDIATYIAGRGFAAASDENKKRLIAEEYWAATWLNDIESWSNWRRTNYPTLTPTQDPNRWEANEIPRRLKYWENEISSNPGNYKAAIDRMGGDNFMTKMWWDGGN